MAREPEPENDRTHSQPLQYTSNVNAEGSTVSGGADADVEFQLIDREAARHLWELRESSANRAESSDTDSEGGSTLATVPPGARAPLPPGRVYGLYFRSPLTEEAAEQEIRRMLFDLAGHRSDFHIVLADPRDPHESHVLQRFGVSDRPALVLSKPFRGRDIGEPWEWRDVPMLLELNRPGKMPAYAVIQGRRAFEDVRMLGETVIRLQLLLAGHSHEELHSIIRSHQFAKVLQDRLGSVAAVLKNLDLSISMFGTTVKISSRGSG